MASAVIEKNKYIIGETIYKHALSGSAVLMIMLLLGIFITLLISSHLSLKYFGIKFIFSTEWDPVNGVFGALPFLAGTVFTSFLAILLSIPFSMAVALFLGEYFRKGPFSSFLRSMIEVMAGIPSVIYGFWGLFFLVPIVRSLEMAVGATPYGVGILSASVILAIMIIPYTASVAREVITMVPATLKEAAYSLGATRLEVIMNVILPYAKSGIFAGILLSLGRAIGETMAVTMIIGNMNAMPRGIFSPANTMASIIANEFTEATEAIYLSAILEIGLILFLLSFVINIAGKVIINHLHKK